MGEIFRSWLNNKDILSVIKGYKLEGADDEVQTALETYVNRPTDNNSKKLATVLGKKPLHAKRVGNAIADVVHGMGRVGGTEPLTFNNINDHFTGGR